MASIKKQSESIHFRLSKKAAEFWMGISGKKGATAAILAVIDLTVSFLGAFSVPYMMLALTHKRHEGLSDNGFIATTCLFFVLSASFFLVVLAGGLWFSSSFVREFVHSISELPEEAE